MEQLQQIATALEKGEDKAVGQLTQQAVDAGIPTKTILDEGLLAGMAVVGKKFKVHDIFLPDVLLAARAMYAGLDILKPLMLKEGIPTIGKVVIGSVKGDLHDIGKNLVSIMLKGAGFEVIDLGSDVTPELFVDTALQEGAAVIGLSALLTTTMPMMKQVIELAKERAPEQLKIIIGGAPVSQAYADEIGADAYAFDGISAVECVKTLHGIES